MKTRQNDLAMPTFQPYLHPDNDLGTFHLGLTKREYFSALVLQGMMADPSGSGRFKQMATEAVIVADALIEALNKETNDE